MKKVLSLILAVVMTVSCFALAFSVNAAEAGTTPSNAIQLTAGQYYQKYWTKNNYKLNCYNKITISSRGYITLTLEKPIDDEGEMCGYELYLVDPNGNNVWACNTAEQINTFSENFVYKVGLKAGTYYLNVKPRFVVFSGSIPAQYKYDFTATNTFEVEPNNTIPTATAIELNKMYSGVYTEESYKYTFIDYYAVKLTKGSNYQIKVDNYQALEAGTLILRIVDPSGEEKSLGNEKMSGNVAVFNFVPESTGTYYIKFDNDGNDAGVDYKVGVYFTQLSLSKAKIKLSSTSVKYDGKEKKPTVKVTDEKGKTLKSGTDYTVKYAKNKDIGTATVTVTGKGNYTGSKTAKFTIAPAKVSGLKAGSQTTTSITLSWTKVKGAKSYVVYSYSSGKYKKVTTVSTNKATIKKLKAGKEYSYAVAAVANSVTGEKSKVLTTVTKPAAPKIKTAKSSWLNDAELEWSKVANADGYEIYMSTSKDGKYKKVEDTSIESENFYDVKAGKTYYYKVRAYVEYGKTDKKMYSDFSAVKSVKVQK